MTHFSLSALTMGLVLGTVSGAFAQAPTPGDILVTGSLGTAQTASVREYTPGGALVRQTFVPYPGTDANEAEALRGVTVDGSGRTVIYHGTFAPYLSVLSADGQTRTQQTLAGWSTANAGDYGGVAAYGNLVFATDTFTYNGGQPSGIVEFNTATNSAQRFADGTDYIADTLGQDGLLYALSGAGSPSGTAISVFDPTTNALVRTISTPMSITFPSGGGDTQVSGIAVNAQGQIFLSKLYGSLYKLAPDGTILASTQLANPDSSFFDNLAIGSNGTLALSQSDGRVVLTDQAFSVTNAFETYNYYEANSFLAIVPAAAPEPSEFAALGIGLLGLGALAIKAKKRQAV